MKNRPVDNISLFVKVLGDIFLILSLFSGIAYLMIAILFQIKNVYPHDYFGLPAVIVMGALFLLTAMGAVVIIFLDKKEYLPHKFMATSLISLAFLLYIFFVILAKMKIGDNESFFTTAKFAFSFFLLGESTIVILSNMMPFLLVRKGYFNSLLHSVAYVTEAILWVVLFVLMITRISPASGFLLMAFLFLRTGLYWWLLSTKRELRKLYSIKR